VTYTPKAWLKYPTKTTPINDVSLKALEQRVVSYATAEAVSPGAFSYEDFRVKQRGLGANMSVDVGLAGTEMNGWVRDAAAGIYRYQLNAAQVNVVIPTADPTNPRIDRIVLTAPSSSDSIVPQILCLAGTPTGGATLDNGSGAQTVPAGYELLADVVVGNAVVSIVTANIRDRRRLGGTFGSPAIVPFGGSVNSAPTTRDEVTLIPHQALVVAGQSLTPTTHDNMQGAFMCKIPRRIVNATRLRFKFAQGATPAITNFILGLYDISGRLIVAGPSTAFSGGANAIVEAALVLAATTFDPQDCFVVLGVAPLTAASAVSFTGVQGALTVTAPGAPFRNIKGHSATGGVGLPTTLGAFTDVASVAAAATHLPLPVVSISVG
jgi:hypothetical protein